MKKFMLIFVNLLTMVRIIGVFMMIPVFFQYVVILLIVLMDFWQENFMLLHFLGVCLMV